MAGLSDFATDALRHLVDMLDTEAEAVNQAVARAQAVVRQTPVVVVSIPIPPRPAWPGAIASGANREALPRCPDGGESLEGPGEAMVRAPEPPRPRHR